MRIFKRTEELSIGDWIGFGIGFISLSVTGLVIDIFEAESYW